MDAGVMVLAAGRGTRLGALGADLPKPLVPLGGRPLLEWNLAWLAAAGAREVWINLHHRGERIVAALGGGDRFGLTLRYSREARLLGTAGGWRKVAARERRGRWLVVYGDNAMRFDLARFLAAHGAAVRRGALATVALFDPARHVNTGIAGGRAELDDDGGVRGFREGGGGSEGLVNAGAYVLEAEVAAELWMGESHGEREGGEGNGGGSPGGIVDFGHDVLPRLAAAGRLAGHVMEDGGFCLGVDTPERLRIAERLLAAVEVAP